MAISWRIKVWDSEGNPKATVENDDAVDSLDSFNLDNAGGCLEAEFRAVPASLNLRGRDIIQLQVDEGDGYEDVWKGYLIQVGPSRSKNFHTYRAVGLQQRFYEIPHPRYRIGSISSLIPEDDVAKLAWYSQFDDLGGPASEIVQFPAGIVDSLDNPDNFDHTTPDHNNPPTKFRAGARFPALESFGELLDGLASLVGRFILPSGQDHSYGGMLYGGGSIIPGVKWGVNASGGMHFIRPQTSEANIQEFDEDEAGVLVVWHDINAEDVVDYVIFVYAMEPSDGWTPHRSTENPEIFPVWEAFGDYSNDEATGKYLSGRTIALDNPLDHMTADGHDESSSGLWIDESNAFDNDADTFAEGDSSSLSFTVVSTEYGYRGAIAHVRIETSAARDLILSAYWKDVSDISYDMGEYLIETPANETVDLYLPLVASRSPSENGRIGFTLSGFSTSDKVFQCELYVPDREIGERVAQAYMQDAEEEPAEIHLLKTKGNVLSDLDLIPREESARRIKVERIEYRITREEGLLTIYHIGQPHNAELMSQKIVMDNLSSRQGKKEAKSLLRAARSVRKT